MDIDKAAADVIAGLGGGDNITSVEPCVTRLRAVVADTSQVDDKALKAAGAHGVMKMGDAVQVVMGTQSDRIATRMDALLKGN